MNLTRDTKLELIKPLLYQEEVDGLVYKEILPVGRNAVYLEKRRPRRINVYEDIHPEHINGYLMHFETVDVSVGHLVAVKDRNGWNCYITFTSDNELFEFFKVREG
ncbi:hypothetical protein [Bacillus suaedae]|uniref:Uncharacterized protein n=1 Tax=Halalkalibacter suaedae TaxID=2822140 RepID=A0A941ANG4_9BACI|nr:hypothetical protein [Bacillus suaedae]MBP3950307.1 hypothetical protein [Bacillus suaedae]